MSFREFYGLPPKKTYKCPECGLETKPGKRCGYHANNRGSRRAKARYIGQMLREGIDEARQ